MQALCDQHERTVCALTQAMWRLPQEASAAVSPVALPSGGAQVCDEVEQSDGEISVLAVRHILGFPDGRSYPPDPAALSAWAIGAGDGGPR